MKHTRQQTRTVLEVTCLYPTRLNLLRDIESVLLAHTQTLLTPAPVLSEIYQRRKWPWLLFFGLI